jgi:hypothetical protein
MATGVSEDEAKLDLCRAMADGKINVQVRIAQNDDRFRGQVFSGPNVGVPHHLSPDDFDWSRSCPLKPWSIGPVGPQHYSLVWWRWQNQPIDLIELATADVQDIFGSPKPLTKRAATRREERMAERTPRNLLVKDKDITSEEALRQCREKHPDLTKRGFKERVWPKGRELAKLSPKAPSGRKPKSPRLTQ